MIVGLDKLSEETLVVILTRFGFQDAKIEEIDSYESYVFRLFKEEQEYFLRISHSSMKEFGEVQAELHWIEFLGKNGVYVSKPLRSLENNLVERFDFYGYSLFAVIFTKVHGDLISKNTELFTDDLIELWGATMGKLHSLTKGYRHGEYRRKTWNESEEIAEIEQILDQYPDILGKAKILIEKINDLPKTNFGLIHYDLHDDNFLVDIEDEKISVGIIDFDDAQYDYFISDIAVTLFHAAWRFGQEDRNEFIKKFYPVFIKGYLKEYKLEKTWIKLLPDFIQLRFYSLFCTVVKEAKLGEDEFGQQLINAWTPMLQQDIPWINIDFTEL